MAKIEKIAEIQSENEDTFLSEALKNYIFWKKKALELQKADKDATKEIEYSKVYKAQLNAFTSNE